MRIRIALLVALAMVACREEKKTAVAPVAPAEIAAQRPPAPPPPPPFDRSLETEQQVTAWLGEVKAYAEAGKSRPDPKPFLDALAAFKRPARVTDAFERPVEAVEAGDPPGYKPTSAEAKGLEDKGEHWEAGRVYVRLNDQAGVRRCADELKKKIEWKAAAMLAVHLGDQKLFDLGADTLLKADQLSRTMDLFAYAVQNGRQDYASAALARRGMTVSEEYAEQFARAGWTDPLRKTIEKQFETEDYPGLGKADMLYRIFLCRFAGKEQDTLRKLLLTYVQQPKAEVVLRVDSGGEGPDQFGRLREAAELWKAVQGTTLVAPYAAAVKRQLAVPPKPEADAPAYDVPSLAEALPALVFVLDEARADAVWNKILADGLADAAAYPREIGRLALGLKADANAKDLKPHERYVVAWLAGGRPNPDDLLTAVEDDIQDEEAIRFLGTGRVDAADALRLWKLVGLPQDEEMQRIPSDQQADALAALDGLPREAKDALMARLLRSGAKVPVPEMRHVDCGINTDDAIDCGFDYPHTAYFQAVVSRDSSPLTARILSAALAARIKNVLLTRFGWSAELMRQVERPYMVAERNVRAAPNLAQGVDGVPACITADKADTLVARAVDTVRGSVAAEDFEDLLVRLARDERSYETGDARLNGLIHGHRRWADDEIARRAKANDIVGLRRLQLRLESEK